jgi:hypothetical protein
MRHGASIIGMAGTSPAMTIPCERNALKQAFAVAAGGRCEKAEVERFVKSADIREAS